VVSLLNSAQIRQDFPIFESGIAYLDSANTAQRPRQVVAAMTGYFEQYNSNIHRAAYKIAETATERYEGTRATVKRFLNARSTKEVIYTRGTTEGINLVARSWGDVNVGPGDLIVLTLLEHHSNIVPWQMLAQRTGARIEYVDIDADGELRLDQYHQLLEQGPKLVAVGQVSNALGTINPVGSMVAAAKSAGAVVLIDGAQGAPHQGVDVQALGCDFYAFSGHKLCGPTGVGVLWGRQSLLESMPPFLGGGDMIKSVTVQSTSYADLPWKFEAGTQAIAEVIGLGAAIDYISAIGMDAIGIHERELTEYALESLTEVDGIRLFGPPASRRAGVISFDMRGIHPHDLATIVDREGVCLRAGHHCAQPLMNRLDVTATARASFYVYTVREEIDRLVKSLHQARRIFGP
jgi:cysteine desulfurase/selenocysteine lyase